MTIGQAEQLQSIYDKFGIIDLQIIEKFKYGTQQESTTIELGFEPKFIITRVCTNDWNSNAKIDIWDGLGLDPFNVSSSNTSMSISSNKISRITVSGTTFTHTNATNKYFAYVAIG